MGRQEKNNLFSAIEKLADFNNRIIHALNKEGPSFFHFSTSVFDCIAYAASADFSGEAFFFFVCEFNGDVELFCHAQSLS